MYVRVLGEDGPLKITMYHMTWLPSRNKAFTSVLDIQTGTLHRWKMQWTEGLETRVSTQLYTNSLQV